MPSVSPASFLRKVYRKVRPRTSHPPPDLEKLFFLHLPKCGGTSINVALENAYQAAGARTIHLDPFASTSAAQATGEDLHTFRRKLLLYYMAGEQHYLSGHFMYSEAAWQAFGDEWRYVTVLRDPVKRWISNYFFNKYKSDGHFKIEEPVETFLESDRSLGYARSYVMWLTDGIPLEEADSDDAIEQAIANLNEFAVVGVLERIDAFAADCTKRFGVNVEIGHRNKNPRSAGQQREELSDEVAERVRVLCAPSLRVYEAARARIDEQGSWLR